MTSDQISYGVASPLTITVRALRAQHEGAEMLVQLLLENGEHQEQKSLVITTEQYCEFNLARGPITEDVYEKLEQAKASRNIDIGENAIGVFMEFRNENLFPVDQHMLGALCADPNRYLFIIASCQNENWVNAPSMWMSYLGMRHVCVPLPPG